MFDSSVMERVLSLTEYLEGGHYDEKNRTLKNSSSGF